MIGLTLINMFIKTKQISYSFKNPQNVVLNRTIDINNQSFVFMAHVLTRENGDEIYVCANKI